MGISSEVHATQAEAAAQFGAMLRRWREKNGWTQYTAIEWAKVARPPFDAAPHSGLSELENGKTVHPRTPLFLYLGEVNARVAAGDYGGVTTRKTLDQLKDSRPILDQAGNPWGPAEFWSCCAGLLAIPEWLQPVPVAPIPVLSDDAAYDLGEGWRNEVLKIGGAHGLRPMVALREFAKACPASAREAIEDGLAGGFTPASLATCWDAEAGEWGPAQWLADWGQSLVGRNTEQLGGGDWVGVLSQSTEAPCGST